MPAGVTGFQTGVRSKETIYDYSKVFARFGNLVTLLCILTVGGLHLWTEYVHRERESDYNAASLERASLQSQLAAFEMERNRGDEAARTLGPLGLGIPPVAPSVILESLRDRLTGLGLVMVSYVPASDNSGKSTINMEVTASSSIALAQAVARLGESPFRNPTVSTMEDGPGGLTARITLEISGISETTGS